MNPRIDWAIVAAAAILGGCSNGLPLGSSIQLFDRSASFAARNRPPTIGQPQRQRSWMAAGARHENLLYLSDGGGYVYVYAYPGGKLEGTLTGFSLPQGECVDGAGDVFITNTNLSQILEFAHGGTQPIATLNDPGEYPDGCAIDPTTGDLAVTNLSAYGSGQTNSVSIYSSAQGTPTLYTDPDIYFMFFCAFDNKGDLFVDGQHFGGAGHGFQLAELPKGSSTFTNIAMPVVVDFPGGVQWDGKYVAVGDQEADVIYHVRVVGITATVVGTTALTGGLDVVQFWIQRDNVVGPDYLSSDAGLWKYPAGGSEIKTFADPDGFAEGSAISLGR
jgi:DNA-binding beta-propeller fold protein YncE